MIGNDAGNDDHAPDAEHDGAVDEPARIERRVRGGLPPRPFFTGPARRAFGISPPARSSRDRRRCSADASARASNTGSRRPRPSAIEKVPTRLGLKPVRPAFREAPRGTLNAAV